MIEAPCPENEEERLRSLAEYGILDTPPTEGFDRLTRLAAGLLEAPIALVTFVDETRQWFKSRVGLDMTETPREAAFCAHTILTDRPMVVEDAERDERFHDNPLVTDDPAIRFYAGAPLVMPDGHRLGALCVFDRRPRSLTDQQIRILSDLAALVVDEIELHRALDDAVRARSDAEAADRAKSEFLTLMSHELRTPLNAVIGFADIIREQIYGPIAEPRYVEYANDIRRSGTHLLDIINDILDLSRIEAGKLTLTLEPLDVADGMSKASRMVSSLALARGIDLVVVQPDDDIAKVIGDRRALRQILVNLLSNAIKFTPDGGRVEIRAERRPGAVAIRIVDTGIGIDPDDIPKLGEPFYQGRNAAGSNVAGTGLGLAITKRLVERQNGLLEFDSAVGGGTIATVALPTSSD